MSVMDSLLSDIYPVGSFYFCTQSTCPMASLISGSTWEKVGSSLITSVNTSVPIKGTGKTLGLTNGSVNVGLCSANTDNNGRVFQTTAFNINVSTTQDSDEYQNYGIYGVTTDSSKSGIVGTVTRSALTVNIFKRTA